MFNKETKSLRQRVAKLEAQMERFIRITQNNQETLQGVRLETTRRFVVEAASTREQSANNTERTKRLMKHLGLTEILHPARQPRLEIVTEDSLKDSPEVNSDESG